MSKYYFTYGLEGYPFMGGWTEVEAPDLHVACTVFREHHSDKTAGTLNCAFVYTEDQFRRTRMYAEGNFGFRCHETIIFRGETHEGGACLMVGLVVTVKNEMRIVDYDAPHYDVIQKAVGGWYEHVRPKELQAPYCMMVNEEGLLMNLPLNMLGSYLYGTHQHGCPIVGDIMFLKDGYHAGEPDVVGMSKDEALALGEQFKELSGGIIRWTNNEKE